MRSNEIALHALEPKSKGIILDPSDFMGNGLRRLHFRFPFAQENFLKLVLQVASSPCLCLQKIGKVLVFIQNTVTWKKILNIDKIIIIYFEFFSILFSVENYELKKKKKKSGE